MTSMEHSLLQLGFTKNEVTVYLALFDIGKCKAGEIIDATKLHRNLVYTALDELVNRELVTKTEVKGIGTFLANDPSRLIEEVNQKRELAQDLAEQLKKKQVDKPREITVFEGVDGVKRSRNKTLQYHPGDTLYVLGSKASSTPQMEEYWREFHKKREKKKINLKMLYERDIPPQDLAWRKSLPQSEAKYLPFQTDLPIWFSVIQNYLEIGIPGGDPVTFGIKSKEAAEGMKSFFEYFWNQEVTILRGFDALQQCFVNMIDEVGTEGEYNVLGAFAPVDEVPVLDTIFEEVHTYRIKKQVHVRMLVYKEFEERMKKRFRSCGDPKFQYSHMKAFLTETPSPFQINLYKGKALLIFYGQEPTIISFEKPEVYSGFKSYFDQLWNQETVVLRGAEALQNIWLEALQEPELRLIGAKGYFIDHYPELFKTVEEKARKIKNHVWKNIVDPSVRGHKITKFPWSQTKYSLSESKSPNVIWLYGNKVAISNWTQEEPVIFVSTNPQLVQSYNDYFDALWNTETETLLGHTGMVELYQKILEQDKDVYIIGTKDFTFSGEEKFYEYFNTQRIHKNIKIHMLVPESMKEKKFDTIFLSEVHYILPPFTSPLTLWIFGEYVAHVVPGEQATIFLLHDKKTAESYRSHYETLKDTKKP